jgi:hypothetical protein
MAFIQIIDFKSSASEEELRALNEEWEKATEGQRTARREIVCRDRNDPNRYLNIVFFDSYESAMENSSLPATNEIAKKWADLTTDMAFIDLDVVDDRAL